MANHSTVWLRWGGPPKVSQPISTPRIRTPSVSKAASKNPNQSVIQTSKPNPLPKRSAISYIGSGYIQINTSATYYIYGF